MVNAQTGEKLHDTDLGDLNRTGEESYLQRRQHGHPKGRRSTANVGVKFPTTSLRSSRSRHFSRQFDNKVIEIVPDHMSLSDTAAESDNAWKRH